jgi:hypothetical protein
MDVDIQDEESGSDGAQLEEGDGDDSDDKDEDDDDDDVDFVDDVELPDDEPLTEEQQQEENVALYYVQKQLERNQQAVLQRWEVIHSLGLLDNEGAEAN